MAQPMHSSLKDVHGDRYKLLNLSAKHPLSQRKNPALIPKVSFPLLNVFMVEFFPHFISQGHKRF